MCYLRRDELAWDEKFRRCLYFFLRDELDCILITESLIESYKAFKANEKEYPFVELRELKPRAKVYGPEYAEQRHFIVIFTEGVLKPQDKIHIRFFDSNKITKENLALQGAFDLRDVFQQRMRYFDDTDFPALLRDLLKRDFALLIQQDSTVKSRYRFGVSHFHVKVDWPVAAAAEDLGRQLRYISKDLYEKGDRVGEIMQQKLYEYYAFHHTVGGRRTAGLVASQYLARANFISTVYIASSESRTLIRMSEQGIAKFVLVRLSQEDMKELIQTFKMDEERFCRSYLIDRTSEYGIGIFFVTYRRNEHSMPPVDGKLREINPEYQWLNVNLQALLPLPSCGDARPIPWSKIYT